VPNSCDEETILMTAGRKAINPWRWQDQFGFAQAVATTAPQRLVFCAGQASIAAGGTVLHPGDLGAQLAQSVDNLQTVLEQAGADLSQLVRVNYYTTDVDALSAALPLVIPRLGTAECRPASTLLGVTRLALPEMLIEIEATALLP
jgi:enamine deaminase RidA (YjgF/YER057c/UK114 family)